MPDRFTPEEARILSPFFTNLDKSIFALTNLPEVVKGALFSRYSRSTKSLRRILLDEFILDPEAGFKEIAGFAEGQGMGQIVATKKAEEFYDRVLVGYGDDSVAELGGASIAVEDISNIATKAVEHSRIGLSPLEKSTRYVRFDQKADGEWKFLREPTLMQSRFADLYLEINDLLFSTYSGLMDPLIAIVKEKVPRGDATDRAFESACRAKACDLLRGLLPASTITNVGIFGNGRAFEYLMLKMYADPLAEIRNIAAEMHSELSKVVPSFVKRCNDKYGQSGQQFIRQTAEGMKKLADRILADEPIENQEAVTLVKWDPEAEIKATATALYPYTHLPLSRLMKIAAKMRDDERRFVVDEYCRRRENRRHKPGRAFENVHYTFDILGNFGQYRDLQRHRMLTQERQDLTVKHGYDVPQELVDWGMDSDFREAMKAAADAFWQVHSQYPKEAQYVVPLAYKIRWYFTMSLREVYFLTELRSMQQGHPDYRKVAQQMYLKVRGVHPILAEHAKFVDMNTYTLERIEAEKKIDKKLEEIKNKYLAKSA
jgi:thymidylate synthase ThyX